MTAKIKLIAPEKPIDVSLTIGGSKSISNRALIIRAFCGKDFRIENLSDSDDTTILLSLLNSSVNIYECGHAGTSFRFMTAYLAVQDGEQILRGSERMHQRPIKPLVEALNAIGADIEYLGEEGFPPLKIKNFRGQINSEISIEANVSSQFISALCMLAPVLPKGLKINLKGKQVSSSYTKMTLRMMQHFGISSSYSTDKIIIAPQEYVPKDYQVESDWSSASYHFAIAAVFDKCRIRLEHYNQDSIQGDAAIMRMANDLGVEATWKGTELTLQNTPSKRKALNYNFLGHPDLFQTIAVIAAIKSIKLEASGLQTLKIKETNRILAIQTELAKIGIEMKESQNTEGEVSYVFTGNAVIKSPHFHDYNDHRMLMSLACVSAVESVILDNPQVVSKSYPDFWKDLETMGFNIIYLQ